MLDKEIVVTFGEFKANFVRDHPGPAQHKEQAAVPHICRFQLGDKGSTVVISSLQLLPQAVARRSSTARWCHTASVKSWSLFQKNPSSTSQCVKNKASTTPCSTEKAAREDEAWISPQPLKFPFSASKPDACSLSRDLRQHKLQSPSASQGSIRK